MGLDRYKPENRRPPTYEELRARIAELESENAALRERVGKLECAIFDAMQLADEPAMTFLRETGVSAEQCPTCDGEENPDAVNDAMKDRIIGDLDKPFHKPECHCDQCDAWRWRKLESSDVK